MIEEAIKAELLAEFNAIPSLEELQKMYSFSERHVKQMEEIFADLRKCEQKERYWHMVRKVAIIIIAVFVAVFASVKFVPKVYAYVKEWLMEFVDDESIEFRGSGSGTGAEDGEVLRFELGYVPEGYELEREAEYEIGVYEKYYKNSERNTLSLVYCGRTAGDLLAVSSAGVLIEEININGIQYYIFTSESGKIVITWECREHLIRLEGLLGKAQMLDIATAVVTFENK